MATPKFHQPQASFSGLKDQGRSASCPRTPRSPLEHARASPPLFSLLMVSMSYQCQGKKPEALTVLRVRLGANHGPLDAFNGTLPRGLWSGDACAVAAGCTTPTPSPYLNHVNTSFDSPIVDFDDEQAFIGRATQHVSSLPFLLNIGVRLRDHHQLVDQRGDYRLVLFQIQVCPCCSGSLNHKDTLLQGYVV